MIDLTEIIKNLSRSRPIFHSEADFQHALAWEIHMQVQNCEMRLEYKPPHIMKRFYVDIWCYGEDFSAAIEMKYKTRRLRTNIRGEIFDLLSQSAQDIGRYDFLKDIQRLEEIMSGQSNIIGYAIFLTNDSAYWSTPRDSQTVDASFRIHHGRILTGELTWGVRASEGTMRGREKALHIKGVYNLNWQDYSAPSQGSYGRFRYLLVKIESGHSE